MELNFRNAVILSIVIHAAFIHSMYRSPAHEVERVKRDEIIVEYIPKTEPEKIREVKKEVKAISVDTPKINLAPKVKMKPSTDAAAKSNVERQKEVSDELAIKQARVKSTKDYISYYQLIREKIRQKLKNRCRSYYGEGDVGLIFTLSSDGTLISSAVDPSVSTRESALVDAAIHSLKDAAPFAGFPKALDLPQMSFTLTVSFKKR